jgi:uncharacterized protein YgbK (DUF1537 family)
MQEKQELPVLVVAGSMSEARGVRLKKRCVRARQSRGYRCRAAGCIVSTRKWTRRLNRLALLSQQQHTILRTSRSADDRQMIDTLCFRLAMSRQQLGELLSNAWDDNAAHYRTGTYWRAVPDRRRYRHGGRRRAGAEGYRIQSEVAPCIPCGTFVNSEIDDLPVITKAGGFGSDSTLCDALYFIEEMYSGN